ncbi:MAG: TBC domain-containing protein, partial [Phycisphaerales bacterium]|nr:TBC domain-containing protein [Phycisphaerales bacterium]
MHENRLQNHRCIAWRYFLGCFKPNSSMDSWSDQIIEDRKTYHLLKQQIYSNHQESTLDVDHPLSTETNSTWKSHFQNEELKKMIVLDVDRTFPECAFFREQETQEALKNILFVFCKTKLSDQYRQGMHELLALIYLVLEQEHQL